MGSPISCRSQSANICLISYSELRGLILLRLKCTGSDSSISPNERPPVPSTSARSVYSSSIIKERSAERSCRSWAQQATRAGPTQTNLNFSRLIGFHWQRKQFSGPQIYLLKMQIEFQWNLWSRNFMPIQSFAISSTISIQIVAFSIIVSNAFATAISSASHHHLNSLFQTSCGCHNKTLAGTKHISAAGQKGGGE